MGRWGHRLFEGDRDIDIASDLGHTFDNNPIDLSLMVNQTDMLAPREARQFYKTEEYQGHLGGIVTRVREQLDSGLGDRLFETYRAKESEWGGKYRVVIVGALMMRAGARIKADHVQHLRDLVPQINCNHRYVLPICDEGFREPGRVQFLAALSNYTPGTPRNYLEPSCFTCGKVEPDLGFTLKRCGRCQGAWYCSKDCQQQNWCKHKSICVSPGKKFLLNV